MSGEPIAGTLPVSAQARVPTTTPRRYLGQLCKHFAHRLPVTLEESHGRIDFPAGPCVAEAREDVLVLTVTASDSAGLAGLQDVVARHLERFAFRDALTVVWQPA